MKKQLGEPPHNLAAMRIKLRSASPEARFLSLADFGTDARRLKYIT